MSEGNRSRSRLLPSLLGLLILLSGLALLAGGIKLASLGGSLYYLLAGIGLALSGLLLLLGKRAALGLYALVLFASTVWALWEVGLDWWQLVPRLALWFVFGLLLWLPWFRRPLLADGPAPLGTAALGVAVVLAGAAAVGSQFTNPGQIVGRIDRDSGMTSTAPAMPDGDWQAYDLYNLGGPSVLGTGEPMEAFDILPAGSRVRLGGLRIAASYLEEELETGDGALRPLARLKGDGASFTQLSRCGAITALFERLYQNPYRGALGRLHEESLTLGLLVELAAYLGGADLRRARTPRAQRDLAHEARRLLEANLGEPPASLELARQLGVGETTLRRIFKNEFGRSMLQYVRDRRLEIGRQMVREGRWQIAQIAYRLGYSSPENFTHAYRARFGHPPGRE